MRRFLTLLLACLSLTIASGSTAQADTNNFQIVEYKIDYQLSRDNSNRSVLKTTETIVADFPPRQNRGIERSIPTSYDGHKTSLSLDSVTNQQGESLEYTTYSSAGNKVIRIGNPDRYVEGRQLYKLAY